MHNRGAQRRPWRGGGGEEAILEGGLVFYGNFSRFYSNFLGFYSNFLGFYSNFLGFYKGCLVFCFFIIYMTIDLFQLLIVDCKPEIVLFSRVFA